MERRTADADGKRLMNTSSDVTDGSDWATTSSGRSRSTPRPRMVPRLNGMACSQRHGPGYTAQWSTSTASTASDGLGAPVAAKWDNSWPALSPRLSSTKLLGRAARHPEGASAPAAEKRPCFEPMPPVAVPEPLYPKRVDEEVAAGWSPRAHMDPAVRGFDELAVELKAQMQATEQRLSSLHEGLSECVRVRLDECVVLWRECRESLRYFTGDAAPAADGFGSASELKDLMLELRMLKGSVAAGRAHQPLPARALTGASTGQIYSSHEGGVKVDVAHQFGEQSPQFSVTSSHKNSSAGSVEAWEAVDFGDASPTSEPSSVALRNALSERTGRISKARQRGEAFLRVCLGDANKLSCAYWVSESKWFSRLSFLVTLANCVAIAADTDMATSAAFRWAQSGVREDQTDMHRALASMQMVFLFWLVFEVLVHLIGTRSAFFIGEDRWWNFLDIAIICATGSANSASKVNGSFARVIRIARVSRTLRAVHFIQYSESLQRMVGAMSSVAVSLFWTGCLFFITFYIVGIAMMEGVNVFLEEEVVGRPSDQWWTSGYAGSTNFAGTNEGGGVLPTLQGYYGSVARTWVTLFRAISGADWSAFAAPMASMNRFWSVVWLLYIFCALFGMVNVVIGTVVDIVRKPLPSDRALRLAAEQKEERALTALLVQHLAKLGTDDDSRMSRKVLGHILELPSVVKQMNDFGVDLEHLEDVIELVGVEGHGGITARVAARRLLSLRGEAKSQDVVRLGRQLRALKAGHASLAETVRESHDTIRKTLLNDGEVAMM